MAVSQPCPYCGASEHRRLADQNGSVCWCNTCHRAWIPNQFRPSTARSAPARALPSEDREWRLA